VTVFGATGTQGGAIVRGLLSSNDGFQVRAVTRDPSSDASQALKEKGAVVVKADSSDSEALRAAVKGAEVVFGVTNFVEGASQGNPAYEVTQGKNMADAAKAEGCKLFIWSAVPSSVKFSNGKYNMVLFENKTVVADYLKEINLPHVILNAPPFAENVWKGHWLVKQPSGEYELQMPRIPSDIPIPFLWNDRDLADATLAVIRSYPKVVGKTFDVATETVTPSQFAEILSKASGATITHKRLESANAGPATPVLNEMYDFYTEFSTAHMPNVPDPGLIAIGHKPSTLAEFAKTDFLKYFKTFQ